MGYPEMGEKYKKNIHSYLTDGVIFSYFVAIEYPVEYWFSRLDKNDESIKIIMIPSWLSFHFSVICAHTKRDMPWDQYRAN